MTVIRGLRLTILVAVLIVSAVLLVAALSSEIDRADRAFNTTSPVSVSSQGQDARPTADSSAAVSALPRLLVQARDLADGKPVPRLLLRARDGQQVVTSTTDESGTTELAAARSATIDVLDEKWIHANVTDSGSPDVRTIWVYRPMQVQGLVRAEGDDTGFDATKATVSALIDGRVSIADLPDPGIRLRAVEATRPKTRADETGRFALTVPRIGGITVAAFARSWKPDTQRIELTGDIDTAYVELWLRKATRIQGTLRSSDGQPLAKVPVYAISLVRLPPSEVSRASLRLLKPEGGFSGSIDHVRGTARAKFVYDSLTDSKGRFDIGVATDGEVVLVGYPHRHSPLERVLGVLSADLKDIDVVVERRQERRCLTLAANGKPVPGSDVILVDMTLLDGDAQPGVTLKLDPQSRMPTAWLIEDRTYHFCIGKLYGNLVWDGRKTLDVARDLVPLSKLQSR